MKTVSVGAVQLLYLIEIGRLIDFNVSGWTIDNRNIQVIFRPVGFVGEIGIWGGDCTAVPSLVDRSGCTGSSRHTVKQTDTEIEKQTDRQE